MSRVKMVVPLFVLLLGLVPPASPTFAASPQAAAAAAAAPKSSPPDDLRPALGKRIWYAPHRGCLDRLQGRELTGAKESWARRYPERELALQMRELVRVDGRWFYRFDWPAQAGGGVGQTPADRVVADTRFDALPSTFYQTCFFLDAPQAVAGFLQAQQPLALQRYNGPSAAEREQEIARIEATERRGR